MWSRILQHLVYRPEGLLVTTFGALIAIGAVLLSLPQSHADGEIGMLDALFTACSAVCVTGLITHDTATAFSRFGQGVILVLIQLGGLGVMTFGALAIQLFGWRASFRSQMVVRDMYFQSEMRGRLTAAVWRILLLTGLFEGAGTLLLYAGMQGFHQPVGGLFEALFLSVSAFCNAGFSVYSDSVIALRDSSLLMGTIMGLIVAGGLGYIVWIEIAARTRARLRRDRSGPVGWTLHSKLVLATSGVLILAGAAFLSMTGMTPGDHGDAHLFEHALFQSVTARTAGFNSVDISALSVPALLILIALMFIGGSPGSCAGGIKTTSFAVWLARVRARINGRNDVSVLGRRVPQEVVRRAALILALGAIWNVAGIMLLSITEHVGTAVRFEEIIFEQVSAFGTVGLSTGITPTLSTIGKLWIIASMFVGRVGPLSIALVVAASAQRPLFQFPTERVLVG